MAASSGFYVNPVSSATPGNGFNTLLYDTSTNQIVQSTGVGTTSSKTFVINHPIKENNYLVHACLEGPEAGVYYRGKDFISSGTYKKVIKLPEYTTLWKDFTVHVTCIGIPTLLGVSEVSNGYFSVFSIGTVKKDTMFNWVVYASRNDIEVEPLKNLVELKGDGPYRWIN